MSYALNRGGYVQRPPTLRVAMPSHAATIGVHRDADYRGHHAAEANFWVAPRYAAAMESGDELDKFLVCVSQMKWIRGRLQRRGRR